MEILRSLFSDDTKHKTEASTWRILTPKYFIFSFAQCLIFIMSGECVGLIPVSQCCVGLYASRLIALPGQTESHLQDEDVSTKEPGE